MRVSRRKVETGLPRHPRQPGRDGRERPVIIFSGNAEAQMEEGWVEIEAGMVQGSEEKSERKQTERMKVRRAGGGSKKTLELS